MYISRHVIKNKKRENKRKLILLRRRATIVLCIIFIMFISFVLFYYITALFMNETHADKPVNMPVYQYQKELITDFSYWNSKCPYELTVVNKDNPADSNKAVDITMYGNKEVGKLMYPNLTQLILAAKKDGIILWVSSGYRSIDTQKTLFENEIKGFIKKGYRLEDATKEATKNVAKPGTSEHQLGLAVDFNDVKETFRQTDEYIWLCNNSYKYGFIERYPENKSDITGIVFEPWHFRYVGIEKAKEIKDSGLCLEEYISNQINQQ